MRKKVFGLLCLAVLPAAPVLAQRQLYIDAQLGGWHGYAEEAYLRRSRLPRPVRSNVLSPTPWLTSQARLVLNSRWSATAGVALGDILSWGYKLTVPPGVTHNPYAGEFKRFQYRTLSIRLPMAVHRTFWRTHTAGVGYQGRVHTWGIGADLLGGITPSFQGGSLNFPKLDIGLLYDTIQFQQAPYYKRRLGLALALGVVVRLYRLDRERLNLTLQLNQGLWDIVQVPFDYSYNRRGGSALLHVRGSGIGLSIGYPILVRTFAPR